MEHNALDNVFVLNSDSDAQDCELAWERLSGYREFGDLGNGNWHIWESRISRFAEGFVKDHGAEKRDNVGWNLCWKTEREERSRKRRKERDTLLMVSKNRETNHWHLCCEQILTRLCRCSVWLQCGWNMLLMCYDWGIQFYAWHVYSAHTEVISLMAFSSLTWVENYKALFHNRKKNCLNKTITIVNTNTYTLAAKKR